MFEQIISFLAITRFISLVWRRKKPKFLSPSSNPSPGPYSLHLEIFSLVDSRSIGHLKETFFCFLLRSERPSFNCSSASASASVRRWWSRSPRSPSFRWCRRSGSNPGPRRHRRWRWRFSDWPIRRRRRRPPPPKPTLSLRRQPSRRCVMLWRHCVTPWRLCAMPWRRRCQGCCWCRCRCRCRRCCRSRRGWSRSRRRMWTRNFGRRTRNRTCEPRNRKLKMKPISCFTSKTFWP